MSYTAVYFGEPHGEVSHRFTDSMKGVGERRYDLCKCPSGEASVHECVATASAVRPLDVRVELKGNVHEQRKSRGLLGPVVGGGGAR